ncbi:MAG: M56 family metallopeptidase [Bacteroidota bacterium]
MNFTAIFSSFAEALGWTLLHSLWQGLIVLLALLLGLALSQKKSSHTRYTLSCLAMLTLVGWMAVTFGSYIQWTSYDEARTFVTVESISDGAEGAIFPVIHRSFEDSMRTFVAHYASELVSVWFLGVILFSIRWGGSLYYTHQLRRQAVLEVPEYWQHQVQLIAEKLGIFKSIQLLESARAEVPMVIGHLKPVILLPIGTLAGMTPQQLDSVLAHELAHIRRYDFLINLLLSLVEVALFYHPVYWWISQRIKQERENCCDDMAVSICGNPKVYATALLSMEETRQHNSLAMALQGNKHQLLDRIKRICLNPPASYRGESGKAGMALALLLFLAVVVWARIPQADLGSLDIEDLPPQAESLVVEESLEEPRPLIEEIGVPEAVEAEEPRRISPEEPRAVPDVPSALEELNGLAIVRQRSSNPIAEAKIDPPLPSFPPVIRPRFPAYPKFPRSMNTISEKLERDPAYIETLRSLMKTYKEDVRRWKEEYKNVYDDAWKTRQDQIQALYEGWKRKVEQKYGGESMEYARTLNQHVSAFEKALQEQEEVMNESEDEIHDHMEDSIHELEDVIHAYEENQKDHTYRMSIHSDRMAMHGLRMEVHGARMAMHGTRMNVHGQRMNMHGERMKAHGKIIEAVKSELMSELIRDGLHKGGEDLDFQLETDQLIVNGTKLTGRAYDKYLHLIHRYFPDAGSGWGMKLGKNHTRIGTTRIRVTEY